MAIEGPVALTRAALRDHVDTLDEYADSHLSPQSVYEIVGKVVNLENGAGLGFRVLNATEWPRSADGKAIDLKIYEAVVEA